MKKIKRHVWLTGGVLVFALLFRLLYLWQFSTSPVFSHPAGADVGEYDRWACEIVSGQWLWNKVHIHAPLYPYFLALLYKITGFNFFWVRFLQLLVGLAGAVPVYLALCRGKWRRPNLTAMVFAGIVAVYPPLIYYQAELVSEVLLLPLLGLSWYFLRRKNYPGAGVAAGLAAITHPGSLIFIAGEIVILSVWPWRKYRLRPALMFVLGTLICIGPVVGYNSWLEGRFVPIQKHGGLNLFIGNNVNADGTCNVRPGADWAELQNWAGQKAEEAGTTTDRVLLGESLRFIGEHPFTFVRLSLRKAVLVWNWRELISGADPAPLRYYTPVQKYTFWSFLVVGILALTGLFSMVLTRWRKLMGYRHLLWWLLSFWGLQVITVTSGRYRVAMLYPVFIFAAFLVNEFIRKNRFRPFWLTLAVLAASAIVILPKAPFHAVREEREAAWLLGQGYYAAGDYQSAAETVRRSLEDDDRQAARNNNFLGTIYMHMDPGQAEPLFKRAIAAEPDRGEGYMNMAILKSRKREYTEAEDYFKLADAAFMENKDELYYNRGYFYESVGHLDAALQDYLAALAVNSGNRRALNAAGVVCFKKQDMESAEQYFKRALALDSGNTGIMLNLGAIAATTGNMELARQWGERARRIKPDDERVKIFLQMLNR